MRWAGRVARIEEERKVYRYFVGKPEGRTPLGRPRHRWVDGVRMDLMEISWRSLEWIQLLDIVFIYFVSKHPVVVNPIVIDNNSVLHTTFMYINIKTALHVSTLKLSSSGAKSNKLTIHIQRYVRSQNSDKNDTII
jgi:hypothetical protein